MIKKQQQNTVSFDAHCLIFRLPKCFTDFHHEQPPGQHVSD